MKTKTLGYPRIGPRRELKKVVEAYFNGSETEEQLLQDSSEVRKANLLAQKTAGIDCIPCNDFALYDHVLDFAQSLGVARAETTQALSTVEEMFLLARGRIPASEVREKTSGRALEMTKWFDTNYHYIVPEIGNKSRFELRKNLALESYREALSWGIETQPVLLGPVSFLLLSKNPEEQGSVPLRRLVELLPLYERILEELHEAGASWVQLDEPCLAQDLTPHSLGAFEHALRTLGENKNRPRLLLTTYFGSIGEHIPWISDLPIDGLHLDLVSDGRQLEVAKKYWPQERVLSLGVVNGRNVWRNDVRATLDLIGKVSQNSIVSTSCSLLHSPVDLRQEKNIEPEICQWLAFSHEKLGELNLIKDAIEKRDAATLRSLDDSDRAQQSRQVSSLVLRKAVRERVATQGSADFRRSLPYERRAGIQKRILALPPLPTTTIGSFPQTDDIRIKRAQYRKGALSDSDYEAYIDECIQSTIREQERLGLDVLVHGEAERNDMVEFFATRLHGFSETEYGWVQSYGTRCVKPPIIYGDVDRKGAMTTREMKVAHSLTKKHVKGMLTGPVTLLKWSFVRDDQPLEKTAYQLAWALRDEVEDLEKIGLRIIQVDEPALREGLPLKKSEQSEYLRWAVGAFRLATSGAQSETQIHTHMCYAEFNEIIGAIVSLDADVISVESARSRTELLGAFSDVAYPNEMGPGVYDIHSPRVPSVEEIADLLRRASRVIPSERLWVNPDCGLKTRGWEEVSLALSHMVAAAALVRTELKQTSHA